MFKKLKDKIAEEVKSSPSRIHQFAQAAQAAVTSASSSISDITNNDLFTIGGDETPQNSPLRGPAVPNLNNNLHENVQNNFSSSTSSQPTSARESTQSASHLNADNQPMNMDSSRNRRLSNSSIASDMSFRLPSYESPSSMYHLQSDMDISASEAEDRGILSPTPGAVGAAALERVTKEQLYAAYRRTQDRYSKYRGRYADLARHYKNLERENAKARAVLVETQDKALRRISELREQCTLEQSAKAHLENALRLELDEKSLKIEALNTKIRLLQSYNGNAPVPENSSNEEQVESTKSVNVPEPAPPPIPAINLIDLSAEDSVRPQPDPTPEIASLTNKIQKLEQLLGKYKESVKANKDKTVQLTSELQIVSDELEKKVKEIEQLQGAVKQLTNARQQVQELKEANKELEDRLNRFDEKKMEEINVIKADLDHARLEIIRLNSDIDNMTTREEENAISLAENKLSVHKELESKEAEIKMLKDNIAAATKEIKSYEMITEELRQSLSESDKEVDELTEKLQELENSAATIAKLGSELNDLRTKIQNGDQRQAKLVEELKYLELQQKQEVAEKLAMVDRNNYLETRNHQLMEENSKKNKQIAELERELMSNNKDHLDQRENCGVLAVSLDEIRDKLSKVQIENESRQTALETLEKEKAALENEILSLRKELESRNSELKSVKDKTENNLKVAHNQFTEKIGMLRSELADTALAMRQMEKEVSETVMNDMKSQIVNLQEQLKGTFIDKLEAQEDLKNKTVQLLNAENQNHNPVVEDNLKEMDLLKEENNNLLKQKDELTDKIVSYEKNITQYKEMVSEKEILNQKIAAYVEDITSLKEMKEDYEKVKGEKVKIENRVKILENEQQSTQARADSILQDIGLLQKELTEVRDSHMEIVEEKTKLEKKIAEMEDNEMNKTEEARKLYTENLAKNEEVKRNVDKLKSEMETILLEKNKLNNQVLELQYSLKEKEAEISKYKENNEVWQQKLASILEENNVLQEKCERLKQEKENFHEKIIVLEQRVFEYDKKINMQEESKIEKEFLDLRIKQLEGDLRTANGEKEQFALDKEKLQTEIADVINNQREKLQNSNDANVKLNADNKLLQEERSKLEARLLEAETQVENLTVKLKSIQDISEQEKGVYEANMAELNTYKEEKENTISKFETEIETLREKNLELNKEVKDLETKCDQYSELYSTNTDWKKEKGELNEKVKALMEIEKEYLHLKSDYDKLRDDKSRLVSDVEGLQTHLTKVSKDNSLLNDRIREMIANDGEVLDIDKNNVEPNLKRVLNENDKLKERIRNLEAQLSQIDDLERQNSILVEEKLELEDQLKNQSVSANDTSDTVLRNDTERELQVKRLTNKNNELLEIKMVLESKLADMELMERSGDTNIKQLEQKNEKLRSANDKLERRLDEALVSLRHLRALEESTELEYLRNILYEYLTGPGTHSVTLAKVIAAVVKFDERQTQLVMQREKERQGLLGQLGLL